MDGSKAMGNLGQGGRTIYDVLMKQKIIKRGTTFVKQGLGKKRLESGCRLDGHRRTRRERRMTVSTNRFV